MRKIIQKTRKLLGISRGYVVSNYKEMIILTISILVVFTLSTYIVVERETSNVYSLANSDQLTNKDISVGIVFGGGVSDTKPTSLVKERLETAKELLDRGVLDQLIVSGDNRFLEYNEPTAMHDYLVEIGVNSRHIQEDFAGRSTYETCERAKKIFGVDRAILISDSTHLARAVYLCSHFGIESYGVETEGSVAESMKFSQQLREILARDKAIFNIYIYGEKTILGEPININ